MAAATAEIPLFVILSNYHAPLEMGAAYLADVFLGGGGCGSQEQEAPSENSRPHMSQRPSSNESAWMSPVGSDGCCNCWPDLSPSSPG